MLFWHLHGKTVVVLDAAPFAAVGRSHNLTASSASVPRLASEWWSIASVCETLRRVNVSRNCRAGLLSVTAQQAMAVKEGSAADVTTVLNVFLRRVTLLLTKYFTDNYTSRSNWAGIPVSFSLVCIQTAAGVRDSVVVMALCYKTEGGWFDTRWGDFFNLPNPSGRTRLWGLLSL
jgi:hypothetical protein